MYRCFLNIFHKITIKLNFWQGEWLLCCSLSVSLPFTRILLFPQILISLVLSRKVANCWRQLSCSCSLHISIMFHLWWQLFLNLSDSSPVFTRSPVSSKTNGRFFFWTGNGRQCSSKFIKIGFDLTINYFTGLLFRDFRCRVHISFDLYDLYDLLYAFLKDNVSKRSQWSLLSLK